MAGTLGRWLRRLTRDEGELEAESLTSGVAASGARPAAECCSGEKVEILGKLRSVVLQPADSLTGLVAELYDGTDTVELVWLGRRSIAGVEVGRTIRVTGRIAMRDGRKAIYNPMYRLMPVGA